MRRHQVSQGAGQIFGAAVGGLTCVAAGAALLGCNLIAGLDQFDNAVAEETSPEDASPGNDSAPGNVAASGSGSTENSGGGNAGNAGWSGAPNEAGGLPPSAGGGAAAPGDMSTSPPDTVVTPDAGQPSSGEDAGVASPPAGMDAAGIVDAPPAGGWCATHTSPTTLDCHDFDEGQPPQRGFSNNYFTGQFATVTTADFAPGSAPSALLISTPLLDAGSHPQDEQFNDLVAFHPKIELSFALKIVDYDPGASDVSLFRISYQNDSWAMQFDFQGKGASFNEAISLPDGGTKHTIYSAAQPSSFSMWMVVDCLIDLNAHTMSLSYDGVSVLSSQPIQNPDETAPEIFVQAGLNFLVPPANPMMIYTDNVVIDAPQ